MYNTIAKTKSAALEIFKNDYGVRYFIVKSPDNGVYEFFCINGLGYEQACENALKVYNRIAPEGDIMPFF